MSGFSVADVQNQVLSLNDRLRETLGRRNSPIEVSRSGTWRIDGIAGVVRLNPGLEVEVVPKFLDPEDNTWRSDFFVLALLVKTGYLLVDDNIGADADAAGNLSLLVARVLMRMHDSNQRRPLRGYKRITRTDFAFDGDVDWDSLLLPDAEGFRLEGLAMSGQNPHNAVLRAALEALLPTIQDHDTRSRMARTVHALGAQPTLERSPRPLAQRHSHWKASYELSKLVLEGKGLNPNGGDYSGPGFVISTWAAWQSLCEELVRRAAPTSKVSTQLTYPLGIRSSGATVSVRPDIVLHREQAPDLLLDAKYKTRQDRHATVTSGDLYESLAFLGGTDSRQIALLYPELADSASTKIGDWRTFERIDVDDLQVRAVQIQVRGLASRGGFDRLVAGARSGIAAVERDLGTTLPA